jgi:hypothetical protein
MPRINTDAVRLDSSPFRGDVMQLFSLDDNLFTEVPAREFVSTFFVGETPHQKTRAIGLLTHGVRCFQSSTVNRKTAVHLPPAWSSSDAFHFLPNSTYART